MMLIVAAGWCVFREAGDKTESFQTIGVIFNAGLYSFLVFYVGKSYFSYRSTGGLNPGPGQKTEFQKKLEVGSYQDQINMLVDHNMKRGVKDQMIEMKDPSKRSKNKKPNTTPMKSNSKGPKDSGKKTK